MTTQAIVTLILAITALLEPYQGVEFAKADRDTVRWWITAVDAEYVREGVAAPFIMQLEPNITFAGLDGARGATATDFQGDCMVWMALDIRYTRDGLPDLPVTVAHERFHSHQGAQCNGAVTLLETSAVLASWEALANMANHGNDAANVALLVEMRRTAMMALLYRAPGAADQLDGRGVSPVTIAEWRKFAAQRPGWVMRSYFYEPTEFFLTERLRWDGALVPGRVLGLDGLNTWAARRGLIELPADCVLHGRGVCAR